LSGSRPERVLDPVCDMTVDVASADADDLVVGRLAAARPRHHHETRQLGEETITEPRDFLDGTPTNIYATTPPSP
jgi:hypothetical protein